LKWPEMTKAPKGLLGYKGQLKIIFLFLQNHFHNS